MYRIFTTQRQISLEEILSIQRMTHTKHNLDIGITIREMDSYETFNMKIRILTFQVHSGISWFLVGYSGQHILRCSNMLTERVGNGRGRR